MNATANGRARKSLADQIDRLDAILDGLADGLNQAVAGAVQEAIAQVLKQVLESPELQARLLAAHPAETVEEVQPAPANASPGIVVRLLGGCRSVGRWLGNQVRATWDGVKTTAASVVELFRHGCEHAAKRCAEIQRQMVGLVATAWFTLYAARHFAGALVTASVAGAAAGAAAYYLSPWIAAVTSGAGGFIATLAVHVALWFRQTLLYWPADR